MRASGLSAMRSVATAQMTPKTKQPRTFTARVPHGKVEPLYRCTSPERPYRETAPRPPARASNSSRCKIVTCGLCLLRHGTVSTNHDGQLKTEPAPIAPYTDGSRQSGVYAWDYASELRQSYHSIGIAHRLRVDLIQPGTAPHRRCTIKTLLDDPTSDLPVL